MNRRGFFLLAISALFVTTVGDALAKDSPLRFDWVVGHIVDEGGHTIGPSILHTRNGGRKWIEQANISRWPGDAAVDVSAVN